MHLGRDRFTLCQIVIVLLTYVVMNLVSSETVCGEITMAMGVHTEELWSRDKQGSHRNNKVAGGDPT